MHPWNVNSMRWLLLIIICWSYVLIQVISFTCLKHKHRLTERLNIVFQSDSSSDGHFTKNDSLIFNPVTGDFIQPTPSDVQESTWFQLMQQQGGYIAYAGVLMSIDLEALVSWECSSQDEELSASSATVDVAANYNISAYTKYMRDEIWNAIRAHPAENLTLLEMDSTTNLPTMDELLFVHKPTKILTLPGIGIGKENSLASEINTWLYSSKEGSKLMSFASKSLRTKNNKKVTKSISASSTLTNRYLVRPCHRLDFDTSGVIAIGLTPESHRKMSLLFENRHIKKTYIALCAGHVLQDEGNISYPVGKVSCKTGDYNEFACYTGRNGICLSDFIHGSLRDAETQFIVLKRFQVSLQNYTAKYTRIILMPQTGRGHQLRLHLAAIGHPILGDSLHSQSSYIKRCTPRLCLHAEEIQLTALTRNKTISMIRIQSTTPF